MCYFTNCALAVGRELATKNICLQCYGAKVESGCLVELLMRKLSSIKVLIYLLAT